MTQVSSLPASRDTRSPFDDILGELWAEGEAVCSRSGMDGQTDALDSLIGRTCNHQAPSDTFLDSLLNGANMLDEGPVPAGPPSDILSELFPSSPQSSDGYVSTEQRSPYSESGLSDGSVGVQHSPLSLSDEVLRGILAPPYPPPAVHTAGESTPMGAPVGDSDHLPEEEADVDCDSVAQFDLDMLEMTAECGTPPASTTASRKAATVRITDEERRLLEAEGVYLPHDMPLTKAEEKNLKRVRRKIKNRQSAYDSRRRKKEYVDGLEERVERSTEANRALQKKVSLLQEQNRTLIGQLRRLQKMVVQYNPSALQAGACVMVLVLSFSLFFIPKFLPQNMGNGLGSTASLATGAVAVGLRSRSLLNTATDEYGYVQEELLPADADEGVGRTPPPGGFNPHTHFTEEEDPASHDTDAVKARHVEDL